MRTGTVSYKLEDLKKGVIIPIGFEGENDFTRVIIDAKEVFKNYPNAIVSMKVQPPEGAPYPATVIKEENNVIWQVKAADVANRGGGELQLTFTEGETVIKTYIARTDIKRSLKGNGPAPDPVQDWIDRASEMLEEADHAIEEAESAAQHAPIIGLDGYWYRWDAETEEYVTTGTKAQGEKGDPGQPGAPGDPTQLIDDTAGEGQTGKTWSADKLDEELTDVKSAIHGIDMKGELLSDPVKSAIINLFSHVVYVDDEAQTYIQALQQAWANKGTLSSISADFEQGSAVIYAGSDLSAIKQYLTVTGTYTYQGDTIITEITDYTLSGSLTEGTCTITVTYQSKTTTFTVEVTGTFPSEYQKVEWVGIQRVDPHSGLEGPFIETGFTASEKIGMSGYYILIDCIVDEAVYVSNYIVNPIISWSANSACYFGSINIGSLVYRMGTGTTAGQYLNDAVEVGERNQFHVYWDDESIHIECGEYDCERTYIQGSADLKLRIGSGTWQEQSSGNFKIYGAVVIKKDNVDVANLVPCYRKADSVIGFYDTIRETFYTNSGSGNFAKGSDI